MGWAKIAINFEAWLGFFYVAVFSQWLGFFAWYRGLALGGTVRVSQMQLLQPFLSMLFAVPILGEQLDLLTVGAMGRLAILTALGPVLQGTITERMIVREDPREGGRKKE